MKKLLSLLTLLLCLLLCLLGCTKYKKLEPDADSSTVVGTVAGKNVYLDELKLAYKTCREQLISAYGEGIFEGAEAERYSEMLREQVASSITADYAVLLLCEEAGISLGEPIIVERVDEKLQALVDELGSMNKYKKYLKENCLTDRLLRFSTEISLLQNELLYVYRDDISLIENNDEEIYEIIKDEFIVVRHIFIPHSESDVMSLVTEALLDTDRDFASLMAEYNRDPDITDKGMFILRGYMSDEYEAAAFDLRVGERSEVVSDSKGLYIIERLKMNTSEIMFNFDYLKELYQTYTFYSIIDQKQETLEFVPNTAGLEYIQSQK